MTEKMGGEKTTLYREGRHAWSVDSRHHVSRGRVKHLHGGPAPEIPKGWRICGENVYARHFVSYESLESYCSVFSIWNEANEALSWEETDEWAAMLGLSLLPAFYEGAWDAKETQAVRVDTTV